MVHLRNQYEIFQTILQYSWIIHSDSSNTIAISLVEYFTFSMILVVEDF